MSKKTKIFIGVVVTLIVFLVIFIVGNNNQYASSIR